MNKIQKDYDENGFAILQNIVPISRINALLENIYNLYKKYSNDTELDNIEIPWDNKLFHEKLIKFRQTEPKLFGAIYDSLKTSLTLTQLVSDDSIVKNIAEFLNVSPSDISISEPMCRLDVPNDKRNALEWHQERSFFPQNRDGKNGLVCWIPLMDVTEKMGAIHVSPKSHNDGLIKTSTKQKDNPSQTTQITVPDENVKKYDELVVPVNAGDSVFFNMLLFHRSGNNLSNNVRIAVQGRYHISTADDFIPFELNNYRERFLAHGLVFHN